MEIIALEVAHLDNVCHLVHDGRRALVVDPPRDLRAVEHAARVAGVEIAVVADTHLHHDHLSGALALARRHGADYLLSAEESVAFERVGTRDGDVLRVGRLEVEVLATPGHTRHHQAFLVRDPEGGPDALLSGGSLLRGTVGRTDPTSPAAARDLAGMQWAGLRVLAGLDPATRLLPTHGPRSVCAARLPAAADGRRCAGVGEPSARRDDGTLADELRANPALRLSRETFVHDLLADPGPLPRQQHRSRSVAALNRTGAGRAPVRTARPATAAEVSDAVLRGSWVIDLRDRRRFATGHLPGSISVEHGAGLAAHVGWLVPCEDDLVLLTDSPDRLAEAVHQLAELGIDAVTTHVVDERRPDAVTLEARCRRADWRTYALQLDLADATSATPVLVDVRDRAEFDAGHLPGAVHLPLHEIETRAHELPAGELWVHCRTGQRAGVASSLLQRLGRVVVHLDDRWENAAELLLPLEVGAAAGTAA
ncbi:MBL fold metallo-hydrolase [Nocardioides sp. TRM66260-LWL]|uniref:rhodanese-like domain-containing protein n=1 Tax=Nocardioides sp. TRM66260-LWL TaxID=2874478 RepID=UPI001CC4E717|nr:rhodanese-like domain-containing protein [Nocardioides sp. TRM66260-LWL]MBZ5733189.1 MBL fold metallo-hydrolase [Nocardioides sp. TRM66260-LWL]